MADNLKTKTVNTSEEIPTKPTKENKADACVKRAARIITEELKRAEAKFAAEGKISNK